MKRITKWNLTNWYGLIWYVRFIYNKRNLQTDMQSDLPHATSICNFSGFSLYAGIYLKSKQSTRVMDNMPISVNWKVGTITVNPCVLFWKLEKSSQFEGRTNFILFVANSSYWHVILSELTFYKLCLMCESFLSMQLWRTILLKPFKLVTVFIHEASHAIACKLTCGHVRSSFVSTFFLFSTMY